MQVHSKRRIPEPDPSYMYYLSDGVYGSFNCVIFDHFDPAAQVLTRKGALYTQEADSEAPRHNSSLWGPTCDSMDCIAKGVKLPELEVGDWLLYEGMGAYTSAAASNFNGLHTTQTVYIDQGERV